MSSTKMTPEYRQYLLKKKGITQGQIAQELGISQMSVSKDMNDDPRSHRTRCHIAKKLGLPVDQVFPDYYGRPPRRKTSKRATSAV